MKTTLIFAAVLILGFSYQAIRTDGITLSGAGTTDSPLAVATDRLYLHGTYSQAEIAETNFQVSLGVTLDDANYTVVITPLSDVLGGESYWVTTKQVDDFEVVTASGLTGDVEFDWLLIIEQ